MNEEKKFLISILLYILSGIMLTISMPPFFNIPFIGFVALVPVIIGLRIYKLKSRFDKLLLVLFFGLVYTSVSYSWYVDIFSNGWAYFLIVAVAFWHSRLVYSGIKFEEKVSSKLQIFALPLIFSLLEFLQRNLPFVKEWWFIPYPKTQWGFPESLWLLSITGITGLTFLMVLANSTLAKIIQNKIEKKKNSKILFLNLFLIIFYLAYGYFYIENNEKESKQNYSIAVISDMANNISGVKKEGLYIENKKITNKILQQNLELSQKFSNKVNFIVWSENEFFNFNDKEIIKKLQTFASNSNSYLIVDSYMKEPSLDSFKITDGYRKFDVATLIYPQNKNIDYVKKTYLFSEEKKENFVSSDEGIKNFKVKDTKIGMGVCYDFHFLDIVRSLAKDGVKIILMPRDDDMNRNKYFPYYHSTDTVFRAIENNVAIASANTNGGSIVVNPNGKIVVYSPVNKISADIGEVFTNNKITFYTKYGEIFTYTLFFIFALILFFDFINKRRKSAKLPL